MLTVELTSVSSRTTQLTFTFTKCVMAIPRIRSEKNPKERATRWRKTARLPKISGRARKLKNSKTLLLPNTVLRILLLSFL